MRYIKVLLVVLCAFLVPVFGEREGATSTFSYTINANDHDSDTILEKTIGIPSVRRGRIALVENINCRVEIVMDALPPPTLPFPELIQVYVCSGDSAATFEECEYVPTPIGKVGPTNWNIFLLSQETTWWIAPEADQITLTALVDDATNKYFTFQGRCRLSGRYLRSQKHDRIVLQEVP